MGIRETTIYYYFDGKQGILEELLRRYAEKQIKGSAQALSTVYEIKRLGKASQSLLLDLYRAHMDRTITPERFAYERIMRLEQNRNPGLAKSFYKHAFTEPIAAFGVILRTFQKTGLFEDSLDVDHLKQHIVYLQRALMESYLLLGKVNPEDIEAYKDDVADHLAYLFRLYGVAEEVPVQDHLCLWYGRLIVETWPELMKWVVLRFDDFGLMDEFFELLKKAPDLYALGQKKYKELQDLGPEVFARTDFEDSLYVEEWMGPTP